jgi:DNA-binding HxlR family transcriptional regulator
VLAELAELADGGRRYRDIHDALDGISHKVLTDTLRRAERDGLISRHLDPKRVETATLYQLTDLGRSLDEPLGALGRWADSSWRSIEDARLLWDRRSHKVRSDQVAVGTALAGGPPRRSQRAGLPHWAPASGASVEAHFRVGIQHPGRREPPL